MELAIIFVAPTLDLCPWCSLEPFRCNTSHPVHPADGLREGLREGRRVGGGGHRRGHSGGGGGGRGRGKEGTFEETSGLMVRRVLKGGGEGLLRRRLGVQLMPIQHTRGGLRKKEMRS